MTTAEPYGDDAVPAGAPTYVRARCRHDGQTILREAAWSTLKGRVLPLSGYPWLHASTGDPGCPLAVDLAAAVEIVLDGVVQEAEDTGEPLSTREAAARVLAVLTAREALR